MRSPRLRGCADGAMIAPGDEAVIPLHRSDICAVTGAYHDVDKRRRKVGARGGHVEAGAGDHLSNSGECEASLGETGDAVKVRRL